MKKAGKITTLMLAGLTTVSSVFALSEKGNKLILELLETSPKTEKIYTSTRNSVLKTRNKVKGILPNTKEKKEETTEENDDNNNDVTTEEITTSNKKFAIYDPETGKKLNSKENLGDDPKIKEINDFTAQLLSKAPNDASFVAFINRTQKYAIKLLKKEIDINFFKSSIEAQQVKGKVDADEKIEVILSIMNFYNKMFEGLNLDNTKMLAQKVALQEKEIKKDPYANFDYKAQGITKAEWDALSKEDKASFARMVGYDVNEYANNSDFLKKQEAELKRQKAVTDSLQRIVDRNKN